MQKLFFNPVNENTMANKAGDTWTAKPNTKAAEKIKYSYKNNIVVSVKLDTDGTTFGTASTGTITDYNEKLDDCKLKLHKVVNPKLPKEQNDLINQVKESPKLKPDVLKVSDLKWKYLMRSAIRGKNIMMTGPSGCGKTMAAKSVVNALERPDFYFNLGATQDPRSTLIGNTHFNKEDGTFFSEALFVKAIQTPNAVILLDELSRAHPDAHNILMTVLDQGQRYLRLDEADGSPTIKVAKGVTFIATANIGNEYTATRVMDRALLDRFIIVEMDVLDKEEEQNLLEYLFPKLANKDIMAIADIVGGTRQELKSETPRISTHISTRNSVEMASLIYDGFTLPEAAEVCIYPQYDASGGIDSERTFVKQLVQKWSYDEDTLDDGNDDLFNVEDTDTAS
jgi:nitric oxide reductase NorQ protein